MTIGADKLLNKFGSALAVAEALLEGKILSHDEPYVQELVPPIILQAAEIRLKRRRPETVEYIDWLETTLIPDLKESGRDATAEDFEKCIEFMK